MIGLDHLEKHELAQAVDLLVDGLYQWARAGGMSATEADGAVAATLAYARRRLTGEVEIDAFGFDADFTEHVYLAALRPLYRIWFRTEVVGAENLPATGGALVVANHAGTVAVDALMTQVAVHDALSESRYLRLLGADLVFRTPFLGEIARRGGATMASRDDAQRLLEAGELVGVWPEGYKGVGKGFSERYRLQRFGRGGFVASALRAQVPIIPCSIVGSEEAYPMLADIEPLAKLLRLPYFPVTPLFPHFGLLGLVPLPSKWMIRFGEPISPEGGPEMAFDDPVRVFELTEHVRGVIQQQLYELLEMRGSAFAR